MTQTQRFAGKLPYSLQCSLLCLLLTFCISLPADAMSLATTQSGEPISQKQVEGLNGRYVYAEPGLMSKPVTIQTTVSLNGSWNSENATTLHLAGLSKQPGGIPAAFSIAWAPDPEASVWFPRWRLVVVGDMLGQSGIQVQPDGSISAAGAFTLTDTSPLAGHTYITAVGINPVTKVAAISVTDNTTGEMVGSAVLPVENFTTPWYLTAGVAGNSSTSGNVSAVKVDGMQVYPAYLPVNSSWMAGTKLDQTMAPSWIFKSDDNAFINLKVPGPTPPGVYRFSLQHGSNAIPIAEVEPVQAENWIPLPVAKLPLGRSALVGEYVSQGQAWLRNTLNIVIGSVTLRYDEWEQNRAAGILQSGFTVSSRVELTDLPVQIHADLVQLFWNESTKNYDKKPYQTIAAYKGSVKVNSNTSTKFTIPLPKELGMWQVSLRSTNELGLAVESGTNDFVFNTYSSPKLENGKPFTIAVLPDTQLYTRTNAPIFMRQTQWLAENAAAMNMAMVLHMGDVTEQNRPGEWEIASSAYTMLDGVVPYALAVGNHDILRPQDGYKATDWDASLINNYFEASRFALLQGTYAPGRVDNSYHTFSVGGKNYLVMSIEYAPRDKVLEWANRVVSEHPNHTVIVATHQYITGGGGRYSSYDTPTENNNGQEMWTKFVSKHKNVLLVLSGHFGNATVANNIALGQEKNLVYGLLFDYQGEPNGGNGWLGLLEFAPDGSQITVKVYSPYRSQYKTDTDGYGFRNQYVIPVGKAFY